MPVTDLVTKSRAVRALLAIPIVALAAAPPSALGASVSVARTTLSYEAAPGEANDVTFTRTPDSVRISDRGAPIAAGAGCAPVTSAEVECAASRVFRLDVVLGDMDDVVSVSSATPVAVRGGEGNDVLLGGEGGDHLIGGPGDDLLRGGMGEDLFFAEPGADVISGGSGSVETLSLEEGEFGGAVGVNGCEVELESELATDTILYVGNRRPVRVTLDGRANDGVTGEGDNVMEDVEWVVGGTRGDVLVGNDRQNFLIGWNGDDRISARGGSDLILGGRGDDWIGAGFGRDCAGGGSGDDVIRGDGGRDVLAGERGADLMLGGPDGDFLFALDRGRDVVDGGSGVDRGIVDRELDRVRDIERLAFRLRPARSPGPALTGR